ncbi:MAG: leucyl aminopeptidase family protein [Planctomycetota bacterium]|nr:leucyl aminopeptidase family protein [Planctomycetota bacterium]
MFQSVSVSSRGKLDALVIGVFQPEKGGVVLDDATRRDDPTGAVQAAAKRGECTGELGSVCEAHPDGARPAPRVLLVGLGPRKTFDRSALRHVAGVIGRRIAQTRDQSVAIDLDGPLDEAGLDPTDAGQAMGEGFGLLAFTFDDFKGGKKKERTKLALRSESKPFAKGLAVGLALAESINESRRCGNTPPNVATPDWMAAQAKALARGNDRVSVRVIKGEALEKEKLTGIRTVGRASANPPCLIRIEWKPSSATAAKKPPIVLLGKTITYDTGGLSLKVNNGMRGMKGDKDGGCAVLGAMHAVANVLKPNRRVIGLLAAAENSVSDDAYRPDDVMEFRNGVTVEVTNTDAEGRLVLADGLCWACDKEKPAAIVDLATLTGGVVVALGSTFAGMWCEDDELRSRIEEASSFSGERVWRLPLHQEYRDMMKSSVADIINSSPQRKAHPIQGAAFLSHFVKEGTPWCHIDIAGVHRVESDSGPYVSDTPTGFGVRLLARFIEQF